MHGCLRHRQINEPSPIIMEPMNVQQKVLKPTYRAPSVTGLSCKRASAHQQRMGSFAPQSLSKSIQ